MRTMILITILTVMLLQVVPGYTQTQASLGGLTPTDDIDKILSTMGTPDLIKARRMVNADDDYAALLYDKRGLISVGMTSSGDQIAAVLTESAELITDDGLRVGDPRSRLVEKRGQPDETESAMPGITEFWYWLQGINFGINDKDDSIANIFVFPVRKPDIAPVERVSLTGSQLLTEHEYKQDDTGAFIVGRASNKTSDLQYGVRVGIVLRDKDSHTVDVIFSEIGSMLPNSSAPFKISIQPKGKWNSYSVDVQALTDAGSRKYKETQAELSNMQERYRATIKLMHAAP